MNIIQAAVFSASEGVALPTIVGSGVRKNPSEDALVDGWNKETNPDNLVNLLDVVGRVGAHTHDALVRQLLAQYSMHYPDYERNLIQAAIKQSAAGASPNSLAARQVKLGLKKLVGLYAEANGPWVPLNVAKSLITSMTEALLPADMKGRPSSLSNLHALADFETQSGYPFGQKYVAAAIRQSIQPVTTSEYVKAAEKTAAEVAKGMPLPNPRKRSRRR